MTTKEDVGALLTHVYQNIHYFAVLPAESQHLKRPKVLKAAVLEKQGSMLRTEKDIAATLCDMMQIMAINVTCEQMKINVAVCLMVGCFLFMLENFALQELMCGNNVLTSIVI